MYNKLLGVSAGLAASFLSQDVTADIRLEAKPSYENPETDYMYLQKNVPVNVDASNLRFDNDGEEGIIRYRYPADFGYAKLADQEVKNNDQFIRSNIDNQANQRDRHNEPAQDMLPCRRPEAGVATDDNYWSPKEDNAPMTYGRGVTVQVPVRWNNPHDSDCEVNIWNADRTKVAPVRRPFPCGGGYQDMRFSFTIPRDLSDECDDGSCFIQIYGHSVETRTYAICIDFKLIGDAPVSSEIAAADTPKSDSLPSAVWQDAIHYFDSYDTSHVDSDYSVYRGQQKEFIRDELAAAIELRSYINNGGLVPVPENEDLQDQRDNMKKVIEQVIEDREEIAIALNKANGSCFEADLYGYVNYKEGNCKRQYKNTYVTNVGYRQIADEYVPIMQNMGLTAYKAALKTTHGNTPVDPVGQYKVKGKPSMTPDPDRPRLMSGNIGTLQKMSLGYISPATSLMAMSVSSIALTIISAVALVLVL